MQGSLAQLIEQEGKLDADHVVNVLCSAPGRSPLHGKKFGHGMVNAHTILIAPTARSSSATSWASAWRSPCRAAPTSASTTWPGDDHSSAGTFSPGRTLLSRLRRSRNVDRQEFERLFSIDGTSRSGINDNWLGWHASPKTSLPNLRERLDEVQTALIDIIAAWCRSAEPGLFRTPRTGRQDRGDRLASARRLPPLRTEDRAPVTVDKSRGLAPADSVEHRACRGTAASCRVRSGRAVIVGRQATSDLCLEDDSVSQKHALLVCLGDIWWAFDLKSSSGTTVNQGKVTNARCCARVTR